MKQSHGFTLIELMITLAIAGVLLTVAVPGFQSIIAGNRITAQTNNLVAAFQQARSEAIKRGVKVMVTAIDDPPNAGNQWGSGGFGVWVDLDNSGDYSAGEELQVYPPLPTSMTLENSTVQYTYSPSGRLDASGTFELCDDRSGETGREIDVSLIGRVSASNLTCP